MMKRLAFFSKNLVWTIPAAMVLGLVFGYFVDASPLKSAVLPLTIVMIYPMMVTLNVKAVFSGCDYRLQAVTQGVNFVVIPLVALLIGKLFFAAAPLTALGLFLVALMPTSGMTISWTGFARGNVQVAVKMTIFGLLLGALATPIYVELFMGEAVKVSLLETFQQIAQVILIPLVLGVITQTVLVRRYGQVYFNKAIKPFFPSIATLAVLGIVFVAMALKARAIIHNPVTILGMIIPLMLFYLTNFAITTLVGRLFFPRGDAIALVYGSVMRNLSVALAISMVAFGAAGIEIALIIAVAFVVQVQAAAWYVKLADKLFGPLPQESERVQSPA